MSSSTPVPQNPVVLAIDIGGSHVKIMLSSGGQEHTLVSGPTMTAAQMVDKVHQMSAGLKYDVITMGYPGPVVHNKILAEPKNLAAGWIGFDFDTAFGKPLRIINDALMQAIGSYKGGRLLFLGLGTGLGAAMIVENVAQPMEIGHLPYRKGKTYEDYVGEAGRQKRGTKAWRKHVFRVIKELSAALEPDDIVIGGGNVTKLPELPVNVRRGANSNAFDGGFRLWTDKSIIA